MVTLVKPPITEDERMWKKGMRNDNTNYERGNLQKGVRFFLDDEDHHQAEASLMVRVPPRSIPRR